MEEEKGLKGLNVAATIMERYRLQERLPLPLHRGYPRLPAKHPDIPRAVVKHLSATSKLVGLDAGDGNAGLSVWSALDTWTQSSVAVHLFQAGRTADYMWELEIRRQLGPNCKRVLPLSDALDIGISLQHYSATIAELASSPLQALLVSVATIPDKTRRYLTRLAIARQIIRAVAELHKHGVVHCDLRPGNILNCGRAGYLNIRLAGLDRASRVCRGTWRSRYVQWCLRGARTRRCAD